MAQQSKAQIALREDLIQFPTPNLGDLPQCMILATGDPGPSYIFTCTETPTHAGT